MPIINCKLGKEVKIFHESLINIYNCEIGDFSQVGPFVEIQSDVIIGKNCKISSHTFLCTGVKIGDRVFVGHGVMTTNDRYPKATNLNGELQKATDWFLEEIIIENDVSIGSNVTILPGVTIGAGSTIGAGAVVTKNVVPGSVVTGINEVKHIELKRK